MRCAPAATALADDTMTDQTLPDQTMTDHQLQRNLRSMGMACFVKYFAEFANQSLPNQAVIKTLLELESYTPGSCANRVSRARRIIKAGRAADALLLIAGASNVDYRTTQQAKALADELVAHCYELGRTPQPSFRPSPQSSFRRKPESMVADSITVTADYNAGFWAKPTPAMTELADATMTDQQLKRNLQSVGMACFVKYFAEFSDESLPNRSAIQILRERELYTEKSYKSRVSHARSIIQAGRAADALLLIAAAKVDYRTKQQAKALADELAAR